jgi:hypothetical protein
MLRLDFQTEAPPTQINNVTGPAPADPIGEFFHTIRDLET